MHGVGTLLSEHYCDPVIDSVIYYVIKYSYAIYYADIHK